MLAREKSPRVSDKYMYRRRFGLNWKPMSMRQGSTADELAPTNNEIEIKLETQDEEEEERQQLGWNLRGMRTTTKTKYI